jgi:predicted  nucleic acid-binding Zn-ribbon protein
MIQHMIEDRKDTVDSVKSTAQDILSHTDDATEKQAVASQLDAMMSRWNAINEAAASQEAALKAALAASKDYYGKAEPFSEWLESMEKKAAGLEATSAGTIQKQIDEQRASLLSIIHGLIDFIRAAAVNVVFSIEIESDM